MGDSEGAIAGSIRVRMRNFLLGVSQDHRSALWGLSAAR